jgi:subtilisin family serine protease
VLVAGGGSVKARWTNALQGFAVELPDAAVDGLSRNPHIGSITPDAEVFKSDTQSNPPSWGLDRIDQGQLPLSKSYGYATDGTGVDVYVIDTGIDLTHPDLQGRASSGRDFIDNDLDASDCDGHGTHVAGTIGGTTFGVAKNANLIGVRVLDCNGSGSFAGVISGIDWVAGQAQGGRVVANMSLGGGYYAPVNTAVANAVSAGVVMAVAAGNDNRDACRFSPASAATAITVGATTSSDSRASYSNYGTCLDLFAPGSAITSSTMGGGSETWNGTSMATPHVAGVAARYLGANPGASAASVISAVVGGSSSGLVASAGTGSPNRLLNSQFLDGSGGEEPTPLVIATTTLPTGTVGKAYPATQMAASGGTGPYDWSADGLPAGLIISSTGLISGTPTVMFNNTVTFTVGDAMSPDSTKTLSLVIKAAKGGGKR